MCVCVGLEVESTRRHWNGASLLWIHPSSLTLYTVSVHIFISTFPLSLSQDGQVPAVLYSKHTVLDTEDEFHASCFEAFRLLSEQFSLLCLPLSLSYYSQNLGKHSWAPTPPHTQSGWTRKLFAPHSKVFFLWNSLRVITMTALLNSKFCTVHIHWKI